MHVDFFNSLNSSIQMRSVAMCFSLIQVPRCRIHTLASSLWKNFHITSRWAGNSSCSKLPGPKINGLEGGPSRISSRRTVSTKTGGKKNILSSKPSNISHQISEETIATRTNVNRVQISEYESIQHCDIQQNIAENRDLAKLITVIVFDIETTGFSRENERIIEIALQDLLGGEDSTFQTLVNPDRLVPNPHIHGIWTHMVNRPEVPRMKDLIPILIQYIRSRQKPGGQVLLVAHNGKSFDVPFLINEFSRCSFDIPPDWLFVDTLPLARELLKSGGSKLPSKVSLPALREHYGIPLVGSAHRAMSDVNTLSLVLQRLTFDLKMTISSLLERSFTASDLNNNSKKKKNSR